MSRSRPHLVALSIGAGLLFLTSTARGQQPTRPAPPDTSGFAQAMGMMNQMGPMCQTMMQAMMEGTLKMLEQQQVIDRMAAITRRYYEALMKQGFTKEEALHIAAGMKLVPTQPGK